VGLVLGLIIFFWDKDVIPKKIRYFKIKNISNVIIVGLKDGKEGEI